MGKVAYRNDEGGTSAQPAGEDINITGLLYAAHHLAAGDVGVDVILQPGLVEGEAIIVCTGRMQAREDMILQD